MKTQTTTTTGARTQSLKDTKAMFTVGQTWLCENSVFPERGGLRTLTKVQQKQYVFERDGQRVWGEFPVKASDIIESRPGFLKYNLVMTSGTPIVLTLTKQP